MKISLVSSKSSQSNSASNKTLVLFTDDKGKVASHFNKKLPSLGKISWGERKTLKTFLALNFNPYKNLILAGLGPISECCKEDFRRLGALIVKELKVQKLASADIYLPQKLGSLQEEDILSALVQGSQVYDFQYSENITAKKKTPKVDLQFIPSKNNNSLQTAFKNAQTISECVNFARKLGDAPGNLMTPTILARETVQAAKGSNLKVIVWDRTRIKKEKFGGLIGVSLGSHQEPKFIIMEYKGASSNKAPICFVGKGLTFDAGGISIKPAAGMDEMKYDMCGGAATIASMVAIAKLKLKVNVIAFVPSTENLLGESANKPGDILKFRNGKTAEVLNTDAEGRLILADALSYASEKKPQAIFDAATLTGAIIIALGNSHTGFYTKNDKLAERIQQASEKSEEPVWRMPLVQEHTDDIKGTFADLSNIGSHPRSRKCHCCRFSC